MATYVKFNAFVENQTNAKIDWDSDTFKVALSNTAPSASTNAVLADITQIAASGGYTAGGLAVTVSTSRTNGTMTVSATQAQFVSTGTLGPFQYAILYNDTIATPNKPLVAYWDYGAPVTLNNTETFTVKFNNASPGTVFTLV